MKITKTMLKQIILEEIEEIMSEEELAEIGMRSPAVDPKARRRGQTQRATTHTPTGQAIPPSGAPSEESPDEQRTKAAAVKAARAQSGTQRGAQQAAGLAGPTDAEAQHTLNQIQGILNSRGTQADSSSQLDLDRAKGKMAKKARE